MDTSGRFQEKMIKRQKQAEKILLENRLRHFNKEIERFSRQIQIANKNFSFADNVKGHKQDDDKLQADCNEAEMARISR